MYGMDASDIPKCASCRKALAHLHRVTAKTKASVIVSSVWECLYCGRRVAVPERYVGLAEYAQSNGR